VTTPVEPIALDSKSPIRVAVVGCGAVSRDFHVPVLAGHPGARIVALVDRDLARAGELAKQYGVPRVLEGSDRLAAGEVDAVLVATPPFLHASESLSLMRRGFHVLVEKPMALSRADAEEMVRVARETRRALSVALFRRLLPSIRLLRAWIEGGHLGPIRRVDLELGSVYGWPLTTLSNMRRSEGGGGVLVDIGSHMIDLLLFLFPGAAQLVSYQDNARGGVESDCLLRLLLGEGQSVEARVELSRTRTLRNTLVVEGETGSAVWKPGDRHRIDISPAFPLTDPFTGAKRGLSAQVGWGDEPERIAFAGFRTLVDDWFEAIRTGADPQLSGASAVSGVALLEECYQRVAPLPEPWVDLGCTRPTAEAPAAPAVRMGPPADLPGPVLVTGATGFIGTRVCEMLHLRGWPVRALVRAPASTARLARLPIEMALGDVQSAADVQRAAAGCSAAVHCAIGTSWKASERTAVTVGGTQAAVDGARAAGVRRFVHVSSVSVHGSDLTGVLDEATPVRPLRGFDYAEAKTKAEDIVRRAAGAGLPSVILRVATVYGPFGMTMVVRPVKHLLAGTLVLADCEHVPSNTVYVDNVAEAIFASLQAPDEVANGQPFVISDDDAFTWGEYFGYFARELGGTVRNVSMDEFRKLKPEAPAAGRLSGLVRQWRNGTLDVLRAPALREFAKKVIETDPWGTAPRWVFERYPEVPRAILRQLRPEAPFVYSEEKPSAEPGDIFGVNPIRAHARIDRAKAVLCYRPSVDRATGMRTTRDWVRYARLDRLNEA
jgi:predicted dehydrogenase/nucleoside-diphosphate-sugar epimerase